MKTSSIMDTKKRWNFLFFIVATIFLITFTSTQSSAQCNVGTSGTMIACVGVPAGYYAYSDGNVSYVSGVGGPGYVDSFGNVIWYGAGTGFYVAVDLDGCGTYYITGITVLPSPSPQYLGGGDAYCTGSSSYVTLYGSEPGFTYNLVRDAYYPVYSIPGNGGDITWYGLTAGTYTAYVDNGACYTPMLNSITIYESTPPDPAFSGLGSSYCANTGGVGLSPVSPGGYFTGPGININNGYDYTFYPSAAGPGYHPITYHANNGCASSSTQYVTVYAVTTPTFTAGPTSVCAGAVGNVYTTEGSMSNYSWTVSAGGTITAGGNSTSNTVTVTWNTAGARSVSVNYTNANGCTATTATVRNVTVNAQPTPTFTPGPVIVCAGTAGNVYTTEALMSNYVWTVSAGGTITAGGNSTSNTVTVTWNTAGARSVSVNYTDANGCTAATPTVRNVTVNAQPTPTFTTGPVIVCAGTAGNVYTTEALMSNYVWTVSAGGTITGGGNSTSNTVTVTWSTAGARSVSVNYTDANGCTATTPTVRNVTVNAQPTPTFTTGPANVCAATTGNVYTTQASMSNYVWTVSAGGTITSGGTSTSNTVTITWNTSGAQSVSVNYTNGAGCNAPSPTVQNVTVNARPTPTFTTGPATVCAATTGNVYTTQASMSNYVWTVSAGGTITSGGNSTSNTVTVTWNTSGAQSVSVNYTNGSGCNASSATVQNVTVNARPAPTFTTGPTSVCATSAGNVYATQASMSNYVWVVSPGGTITAGGNSTSNTVTVTWNTAGTRSVSVNYTNGSGCSALSATVQNVTVKGMPDALATPSSQTITNGQQSSIALTNPNGVAGTVLSWTVVQNGVTGASPGSGASIAQTLTTITDVQGSATYTITPTSNGCTGSSIFVVVTVSAPLCISSVANLAGQFKMDKLTGAIVFQRNDCSYTMPLTCVVGPNQGLSKVISASATTFDENWNYDDYTDPYTAVANANNFEKAKRGKVREKNSYTFNGALSPYDKNYNSGTFTYNAFNWKVANSTPRQWLPVSKVEMYSPHGDPVQESNALNIKSAAKIGYRNAVPYLTAKNAEYTTVMFESFEVMYGGSQFENGFLKNTNEQNALFAHGGKQSLYLSAGGNVELIKIDYKSVAKVRPTLIKLWVHLSNWSFYSNLNTDLSVKIKENTGIAAVPMNVVARTGDWVLCEATLTNFGGLYAFTPVINYNRALSIWIDDIRVQPQDAEMNAYVYDNQNLRLLTVFDDQHFGLYYLYNAEGKLMRKVIETERGLKTLQETQYNTPLVIK